MAIHHLDVKCAFPHGNIEEDIYMRLPEQFAPTDGTVCKLKRSIYGLRQAPRAWNDRLASDLKGLDYKPFQYAESTFWRDEFGVKVFLLVY